MADREKVIKGLRNLRDAIAFDYIRETDHAVETLDNALALLKEQEAVEPHWRCSTVYMNGTGKIEMMCGNCGISIPLGKPNYCPWCGRAVKWDE